TYPDTTGTTGEGMGTDRTGGLVSGITVDGRNACPSL
ncbi:unnamed protein product, partial [marine sediment metagenome]